MKCLRSVTYEATLRPPMQQIRPPWTSTTFYEYLCYRTQIAQAEQDAYASRSKICAAQITGKILVSRILPTISAVRDY